MPRRPPSPMPCMRVDESPLNSPSGRSNIQDCLARLSNAEKVIADVRSILAEACNQSAAAEFSQKRVEDHLSVREGIVDINNRPVCNPGDSAEPVGTDSLNIDGALELTTSIDFDQLSKELKITVEKLRSIFDIFAKANHSKSGQLSLDELNTLLAEMCDGALEDSQLSFIMDKFDVDRDGMLQFDEFARAFVTTPLMRVAHLKDEVGDKASDAKGRLREHGMKLEPDDWVVFMGCKVDSVRSYVEKEITESGACIAMPFVFFMFFLFFASSRIHLGYEQLHSVDQAIYFDITENANFAFSGPIPWENGRMGHKNMFDVNSIGDFWSWMSIGIVPIFWAEGWEISETRLNMEVPCQRRYDLLWYMGINTSTWPGSIKNLTAEQEKHCPREPFFYPPRPKKFFENANEGTYLYYNSVIGGVRLSQERSVSHACPNGDDDLRRSLHRGVCLPDEGYVLKPELHAALRMDSDLLNQPGGETQYLPAFESQAAIRSALSKLEDQVWLSPYTAKVEVLLTTYNAHFDVFSATYLWIFINRGGHMHKVVQPISTYLTTYRTPICYVLDVLQLILFAKIMLEEGLDIYRACRREGIKAGLKSYIDPSNVVDWICLVYFILSMVYWLSHVHLIGELRDSMRKADPKVLGSFSSIADRDKFYEIVDKWVVADNTLRTVMTLFPFVIGMRFFKVFSLQPRLGVVTATLQRSFIDISHFMVVFGSIFFVFVTAAMILFGHDLEDFTNLGRALTTVLLIMVGEYNWDEMARVGRQQAAVWFWCFTWLINLIMLNMLLAIIMDIYSDVKAHISKDAETIPSQIREIFNRWLDERTGRQISLHTVCEALIKYEDTQRFGDDGDSKNQSTEEQRVTVPGFMEIVPGMPESQARRLLANTFAYEAEKEQPEMGMADTSARVHHIFKHMIVLHEAIADLMHINHTMADMIHAHWSENKYHSHQHGKAIGELNMATV